MPDHPTPALTLFAANVAATAATFDIPRAVAHCSDNWFWVEYDSPTHHVCFHIEGCSRRRQAELRFERSVIEDVAYAPNPE